MVTLAAITRLGEMVDAHPGDYAAVQRWNAAVTAYEAATGEVLLWCDDCGALIPATTKPDAAGCYRCAACMSLPEEG